MIPPEMRARYVEFTFSSMFDSLIQVLVNKGLIGKGDVEGIIQMAAATSMKAMAEQYGITPEQVKEFQAMVQAEIAASHTPTDVN